MAIGPKIYFMYNTSFAFRNIRDDQQVNDVPLVIEDEQPSKALNIIRPASCQFFMKIIRLMSTQPPCLSKWVESQAKKNNNNKCISRPPSSLVGFLPSVCLCALTLCLANVL